MKKHLRLIKTLLVAAGLCVGGDSLWAATTWDFTNSSVWGNSGSWGNNSLYKGGDSEVYYTATGGVADVSTSNVSFLFSSDTPRFNYGGVSGFQFGTTGSTNANRIKVNVPIGATATITAQRASSSRPIAVHDGTSVVQTLTSATSYSYTNTSAVSAATLYIYASKNGALAQQSIASISIAETFIITTHYYYNDGVNNVSIADDDVAAVEQGSSYTLPYEETIQLGDYTYTYSSGAQTIASVTESAEYSIYYTRSERQKYSVSVKAKYGDKTVTIAESAEYSEGEVVKYYAPAYYLDGTTLYAFPEDDEDDNGSDGITWGGSYTVTAAKDIVLNYEAQDGVFVAYVEGEDLPGATPQQDHFKDLMSNGTGGVISSGSPAKVATLPAGIYKLTIRSIGRSSDSSERTCSVVVGDETTSWTQNTSGSINTLIITLTESTDIKAFGGYLTSSANAWNLDFIYIQKINAVPATVGANGYTTFASPYALDLTDENRPAGLKAYKATLDGANLTFTALNQTVPAGTGLLLLGETKGGNYEIPVVASGDAVVTALTGVTADTPLQSVADNTYYFVMKKAETAESALEFAPLSTSGNVTIPAGKAYITVPNSAFESGAHTLNVIFDDETSGIASVSKTLPATDSVVYNLQGQRVSKAQKGLFIQNGKKLFVK